MRRPTIRIEDWPRGIRETSDIRDALTAALSAAEPETILKRTLTVEGSTLRAGPRTYQLSKFDRIIVIGGGKAAAGMAAGLANVLGDKVTAGIGQHPRVACRRYPDARALSYTVRPTRSPVQRGSKASR